MITIRGAVQVFFTSFTAVLNMVDQARICCFCLKYGHMALGMLSNMLAQYIELVSDADEPCCKTAGFLFIFIGSCSP